MSVAPSCPALVVLEDDAFRRALITALDEKHFSVTFTVDGAEAVKALQEKSFKVVVMSVDAPAALEYVSNHRRPGVILIASGSPDVRKYIKVAEETLLKPVDPVYVAERARVYC